MIKQNKIERGSYFVKHCQNLSSQDYKMFAFPVLYLDKIFSMSSLSVFGVHHLVSFFYKNTIKKLLRQQFSKENYHTFVPILGFTFISLEK